MTPRGKSIPYLFLLSLKSYQAIANENNPLLRHRHLQNATPQCHHSAKYHTHMTYSSTCTNDNVYPSQWDQPPMSERFFMATADECCAFYFNGKNCNVIDVCGDTSTTKTTSPTQKKAAQPTRMPTARPTKNRGEIPTLHVNDKCHPSKKWHADTRLSKTEAGCTNNDVYPPGWEDPGMADSMFFDTPEACCEYFFPGMECDHVDVCYALSLTSSTAVATTTVGSGGASTTLAPYTYPENNPCHGRKWHPDTFAAINTCSNNLKYPAAWNNGIMDGITMFSDPEDCCAKLQKSKPGECVVVEDEDCGVVTVRPTSKPTEVTADAVCSSKWHPDEGMLAKTFLFSYDRFDNRCI
jgi:hypothetical protein